MPSMSSHKWGKAGAAWNTDLGVTFQAEEPVGCRELRRECRVAWIPPSREGRELSSHQSRDDAR